MKSLLSGVMVAILLVCMLALTFRIQPARSSPGTIIVPDDYSTIQEAINNANEGDTVFVRNGTYYERIVVNKTLSLVGENENTTIIDGGGSGTVVLISAGHTNVSCFTVRNADPDPMDLGYACIGVCSDYNNIEYCGATSGRHCIWINGSYNNVVSCGVYGGYGSGEAFVILSSNNLISKCSIFNNPWFSLWLRGDNASNNIIDECDLHNNEEGIDLAWGASNNVISNCIVHNNSFGINLFWSACHNRILNCYSYCNLGAGIGMFGQSNYNIVTNCTCYSDGEGIWTTDYPPMDPANQNTIYHNNLVQNGNFPNGYQAYCINSVNSWDNGYLDGGNYWSDYTGIDVKSGPNQDQPGSDGIGDTPYVIDSNNIDHYPLMNPWGSTPVTSSSTSVVCSPNPASVGSPVTCNATVFGRGPTGTVTWTTSSSTGSFNSSTSTLSSGSCSTTYTDTSAGSVIIAASYNGDSNNAPSSGGNSLIVNFGSVATNWNPQCDSYSQVNFISAWAEGNCYGLSSTEILYFMNAVLGNTAYPYLPAQDPPATWTSDLKLPSNTSALNNASLAVMFHQVYDPNNNYIPPSSEKAEFNKLDETLRSGVPALLAMHGKDWLGEDIYHAVVAYGLEMLPDEKVNIKVSDPNVPQQEEVAKYNPSTQTFSYSCYYSFDKFEVITPQAISNSWVPAPWWNYFGTYWWWSNWLSLSVTGYNIVIADKNVTIKSSGLIDKFAQMGNSQTFVKAIPGSSGIEEGNVQVYAIPTGASYTINDPSSNQSTILITRVDNESGQLVGYGYLVNATAAQGTLNFTATPSGSGLSISAGDNALNASITFFSATDQGYSVSHVSNTTVDAMRTVNFTASCLMSVVPAENAVDQGCCLPINVTITNSGAYAGTFNATVCANETETGNSTVIAMFAEVTVGAGNSTTLTLTWDTTGLLGDYVISAYATPVAGEAGTVQDAYAGSTVTVQVGGGSGCPGRMWLNDVCYCV